MRSIVLTVGVLVALVAAATPARAQIRGSLTSRPLTPSAGPGSPGAPRLPFPVWWNWGTVALPDTILVEQPPIGEGAPNGGVQLDIQPWSAQVFVDGNRAGMVEQFRGYYQHLTLPAGPHVIAVVADGYEPYIFVVTVSPGKTVTYRTTLQR